MKKIYIHPNNFALVDDLDYEIVFCKKWYLTEGYAHRLERVNKKPVSTLMHRLLIGAKTGQEVDHINGNKLDNRRSNLRICTKRQNQGNRKTTSKSGFKGVYQQGEHKRWFAQIKDEGKLRYLGSFSTPESAAVAYDNAAKKAFGEFARLNIKNCEY